MDNREYASVLTCQSFGTDYKDLIAMIKEPHAWPNFSIELERIETLKICFPDFKISCITCAQNLISDFLVKTARSFHSGIWDHKFLYETYGFKAGN
ncbi:hypothetical protein Bca4012_010062 [Brassica carinata]